MLSNSDKRFLYDLGVYDCEDDDDENGMGDFLNEMVSMMSQSNVESGERIAGTTGDNRRNGRKQKIIPGQDVSSTTSA